MTRHTFLTVSTTLALLVGAAACSAPEVGMARGEALFDTCAACHGTDGTGNEALGAPAIAGLPQWYVVNQLEKFQDGIRGRHAQDLEGMRMRPMAVSLNKEGDIPSVAEYVASLSPVYPEATVDGDAGRGALAYQVCVTCHGPEGRGNELLGAPPLTSTHDWYLFTQLRKFREGLRGADQRDTWGATMRPNALALDDQGMRNVVAYIRTLR